MGNGMHQPKKLRLRCTTCTLHTLYTRTESGWLFFALFKFRSILLSNVVRPRTTDSQSIAQDNAFWHASMITQFYFKVAFFALSAVRILVSIATRTCSTSYSYLSRSVDSIFLAIYSLWYAPPPIPTTMRSAMAAAHCRVHCVSNMFRALRS